MVTKKMLPIRYSWINLFFCCTLFLNLTACTTAGNAIPPGGPTMAQIYEEAMQQSKGATLDTAREEIKTSVDYDNNNNLAEADYTRTVENEINNLFPLLPNPQLAMYVYPHFAGNESAPVPGYSTAFSLYSKNHYANFGGFK